MIHRETYPMVEEAVVPALETLANTCIDKTTHPEATFIGVTTEGLEITPEYVYSMGVHESMMMAEDLLNGAKEFVEEGRVRIITRFTLNNQLKLFLPKEEYWERMETHKKIDPTDDFRWHLTVRYNEWREEPVDSLVVSMSTNGVDEIPEDDNYKSLYEILFGNTLSSYLNH